VAATPAPRFYEACFELHPDALVFSIEGSIRAVNTQDGALVV
jgi:hypothetical protein